MKLLCGACLHHNPGHPQSAITVLAGTALCSEHSVRSYALVLGSKVRRDPSVKGKGKRKK